MGSREEYWERPIHKVFLDSYWIDQTEVTNAMYAKFVQETGHKTDAEKKGVLMLATIRVIGFVLREQSGIILVD